MPIRSARPIVAAFSAALILLTSCAQSPNHDAMAASNLDAPEFPADVQWLNVDHPLTMKDLRGKVVLLDFWCFCCINCMHVIPDLKKLEAKYGDALAVVGVHSAKYATEKGTDNIRAAILRYDLTHPVINDKDFEVWNSYGIGAWPTFVLIDPDGHVVAAHAGEGPYEAFDGRIGEIVSEFDASKKINRTPLPLKLEKETAAPTPLLFPGKIAAGDGKLFVADSNHNRIVVLNAADGTVLQTIGAGVAGLKDGKIGEAQFFRPQGIAVAGQTIYVADTENHAIRKVDLAGGTVTTLAAKADGLSSPWDVLEHDGKLYIAMAGTHQVWVMDLATSKAEPFAGSGREDIADGRRSIAALAQPSGLASDGSHLYSADSETSSIRSIDLAPGGMVHTVVGKGLFDFGDKDGGPSTALLQHPLGVAYHNGLIYVADTYNNKVKSVDPVTGETHTIAGNGTAGFTDGPALAAELNEPGGLVWGDGKLYIADTNNHLIRVFDPATNTVSTLRIAAAEQLIPQSAPKPFKGTVATLPPARVKPGADGAVSVEVNVSIPAGYKVNMAAPYYVGISGTADQPIEENFVNPSFPLNLPVHLAAGQNQLTVDLIVYYCEAERESLCLVKRLRYVVPVVLTPDAAANVIHIDAVVTASAK